MGLTATALGVILLLFGVQSVSAVYGVIAAVVGFTIAAMFISTSENVVDTFVSVFSGVLVGVVVYTLGLKVFNSVLPILSGFVSNDTLIYILGLFVTDIVIPTIITIIWLLIVLIMMPFIND